MTRYHAVAKKYLPIVLLLISAYLVWERDRFEAATHAGAGDSDQVLADAFRDHTKNLQVEGAGEVVRVLPDDNDGSRHQRFILRLASRQTMLVAHNIDLAPRIPSLSAGDHVAFFGEYEWNSNGGVIHWTHRDPRGKHIAGWLKHNGKAYQ